MTAVRRVLLNFNRLHYLRKIHLYVREFLYLCDVISNKLYMI